MAVSKHGEALGWRLVGLWALASASSGYLPSDINHIAFWLRIPEADARKTLDQLKTEHLIDQTDRGLRIHDWDVWQFASDNSTERVRAHRANKKQAKKQDETFHETNAKRSGNVPNRTEKNISEQEHTLARETVSIGLHQFLAAYPKRVKQDATGRAYVSVIDSPEEHERLMDGLQRWLGSDQWKRSLESDGGRFIPDPDRFIFERMYRDEPTPYVESAESEDKFERAARLALEDAA